MNFRFAYDTKGAVRYHEEDENGKMVDKPNDPGANIGVLYIRKSSTFFGKKASYPERISVTVETESE